MNSMFLAQNVLSAFKTDSTTVKIQTERSSFGCSSSCDGTCDGTMVGEDMCTYTDSYPNAPL